MSIIVYRHDCSMRSVKKTTGLWCILYFSSVKYQFTSISKISISLGGGGVRPLDPLLGLRPLTHWATSVPQDTFPSASIHPPKLPSRWRRFLESVVTFGLKGGQMSYIPLSYPGPSLFPCTTSVMWHENDGFCHASLTTLAQTIHDACLSLTVRPPANCLWVVINNAGGIFCMFCNNALWQLKTSRDWRVFH